MTAQADEWSEVAADAVGLVRHAVEKPPYWIAVAAVGTPAAAVAGLHAAIVASASAAADLHSAYVATASVAAAAAAAE